MYWEKNLLKRQTLQIQFYVCIFSNRQVPIYFSMFFYYLHILAHRSVIYFYSYWLVDLRWCHHRETRLYYFSPYKFRNSMHFIEYLPAMGFLKWLPLLQLYKGNFKKKMTTGIVLILRLGHCNKTNKLWLTSRSVELPAVRHLNNAGHHLIYDSDISKLQAWVIMTNTDPSGQSFLL